MMILLANRRYICTLSNLRSMFKQPYTRGVADITCIHCWWIHLNHSQRHRYIFCLHLLKYNFHDWQRLLKLHLYAVYNWITYTKWKLKVHLYWIHLIDCGKLYYIYICLYIYIPIFHIIIRFFNSLQVCKVVLMRDD